MLYYLKGTFVACILLPNAAFLFSDGLVTLTKPNEPKTIFSNSFSKVHKINDHCGFLTYGRFLPDLENRVKESIKENDGPAAMGRIFSNIMEELWKNAPKENVKTGAMVISFQKNIPYCFVVESTSNPPFKPGPRVMPSKDQQLTIGAVCHDEKEFQSNSMLTEQIQLLIDKGIQLNHDRFREAFDKVKNDLSKLSNEIGGNTFELILQP
jgi:hypothetical protein